MLRRISGHLSITISSLVFLFLRKVGLSRRRPYSVFVKGEPLWLDLDGVVQEIGGFYTVRYVMASSPEDAAARVLRIISEEVSDFAQNPSDKPVQLEVEDCQKLFAGYLTERGGGFTFWPKHPIEDDWPN